MTNNKDDIALKTPFFKEVYNGIVKFENYGKYAIESIGATIKYIILLVLLVSFVSSLFSIYGISNRIKRVFDFYEEEIKELSYSEGILSVNGGESFSIYTESNGIGEIIVDTSDLTDEKISEYEHSLSNNSTMGVIILKDKAIIVGNTLTTHLYKDLLGNETYNKESIVNVYNNYKTPIILITFLTSFSASFILYLSDLLIWAMMLAVLAYTVARISHIRLTFKSAFSIAIHGQTLSMMLQLIYNILIETCNFEIKYFSFMYITIATIYVITAVFMIKSDLIMDHIQSVLEKKKREIEMKQKKEEEEKQRLKEREEKRQQRRKEKEEEEKKKTESENNRSAEEGT